MVLTCQQEMARIFYSEYLLELSLIVLDFSFIVYFDRANVIELNWETKRSQQTDGCRWKIVLNLLDSQQTFIRSQSSSFEFEYQRFTSVDLEYNLKIVNLAWSSGSHAFERNRTVN